MNKTEPLTSWHNLFYLKLSSKRANFWFQSPKLLDLVWFCKNLNWNNLIDYWDKTQIQQLTWYLPWFKWNFQYFSSKKFQILVQNRHQWEMSFMNDPLFPRPFLFVHFMCGTHKKCPSKTVRIWNEKIVLHLQCCRPNCPQMSWHTKVYYTISNKQRKKGEIVLFYFWQPITENGEMTIANKNESVHMIRAFQFNRIAIDSVIAVNLILQLMQI